MRYAIVAVTAGHSPSMEGAGEWIDLAREPIWSWSPFRFCDGSEHPGKDGCRSGNYWCYVLQAVSSNAKNACFNQTTDLFKAGIVCAADIR
jgi:hypothetical protein